MPADKYTLKQALSEKVSGMVWKFITDEETDLVAVESRNQDLKEAAFSVFNYREGTTLISEKIFEEKWGLSLIHIQKGYLYLTANETESTPVNKGIIAVDATSGKIVWQNFTVAFYDAWQEGMRVYNPNLQPRKLQWLDHFTGISTKVEDFNALRTSIRFPEATAETVLPSWLNHLPIYGDVQCLKHHYKTILCFHEKINNTLQLRLIVYQEKDILLDNILMKDIQKLQPETFMVQQNHLFCIRNRNEIVTYFV